MKTKLEIKVDAINCLNEYTEKYIAHEKNYFTQFLGKDIFKIDGSIKQKFAHEKLSDKGNLPDGSYYDAHYWFTANYGRFDIHVKICISGGSYDVKPITAYCEYQESSATLFEIKDCLLINTEYKADFSARYNAEEISTKAKAVKEAAEKYQAIHTSFPYQFKDVCNIERLTR